MDRDLSDLSTWFHGFAEGYFHGPGKRVLELKRDHCLRVLEECRGLTRAEGFEPDLARACHAGALLHDVGRFPQYQKYATLRDAGSVNHAALSVATIKRARLLGAYGGQTRRLILYAVVLHNRKNLPVSPNTALGLAAGVLRDSDKLDILRVMLDHFEMGSADREAAFFGLDPDPKGYSPHLAEAAIQRRMGGHGGMRYRNDFFLLALSWAYDLNFAASRRFFLKRGYVQEIAERLPRVPAIEKLIDQVTRDLTDEPGLFHSASMNSHAGCQDIGGRG
ncbi:MAG: HD domain-containing protein [Desulfovibrionaceae bacterium]|nr:HD domain-containing protein [Desulfovibrionaceae bacterium]MBF0513050.1 HD domain-containing protein [Desulfovibrionaceae bacterium]